MRAVERPQILLVHKILIQAIGIQTELADKYVVTANREPEPLAPYSLVIAGTLPRAEDKAPFMASALRIGLPVVDMVDPRWDSDEAVVAATRLGVNSFIQREHTQEALHQAVDAAMTGKAYVDPYLRSRMSRLGLFLDFDPNYLSK